MTRSTAREIAIHLIFSMGYNGMDPDAALEQLLEDGYYAGLSEEDALYQERPNKKQLAYIRDIATGCTQRQSELDAIISRYAIGWHIDRISRLVRVILRTALYEILYVDDVPTGVAINEAVMLTRKYDEEETVAFVNGILGAFSRELSAQNPAQEPAAGAPAEENAP